MPVIVPTKIAADGTFANDSVLQAVGDIGHAPVQPSRTGISSSCLQPYCPARWIARFGSGWKLRQTARSACRSGWRITRSCLRRLGDADMTQPDGASSVKRTPAAAPRREDPESGHDESSRRLQRPTRRSAAVATLRRQVPARAPQRTNDGGDPVFAWLPSSTPRSEDRGERVRHHEAELRQLAFRAGRGRWRRCLACR